MLEIVIQIAFVVIGAVLSAFLGKLIAQNGKVLEEMKRGFEKMDRGFEKMDRGFDEMRRGFEKMDRGFDEMKRGMFIIAAISVTENVEERKKLFEKFGEFMSLR